MNFAVVHHLIALPRVSRTKYRLCLSRKCLSVGPYSLTQRRFSVAGDHHLLSVPPSESEKSTIFALSTPPGVAGIAVVRVSGPRAFDVWNLVVSRPNASPPDPWRMEKCSIVHPISRERLDDGLAVYFKGPKSFTTQDVVELHIHSGRALITSVLEALACLPYCRPAEPGEFTRQAVEGGRLDLAQVEGLHDLIHAETETQRRQALLIADGTISKQYSQMRSAILRCLAHLEALIDFSDTDDVDTDAYEQARMLAKGLREDIIRHLEDHRGEIVRSGLKIAIFGPPNAGKSSLLNFLAQRDAAIVTEVPGTTRDVVEVSLDFGGLLVTLADTAGLRDTDDIVESIGIQRAKQAVSSAAMSLCVLPSDAGLEELNSQVQELLCSTSNSFLVLNKSDLFSEESIQILSESLKLRYPFVKIWVTSFKSGDGTQKFVDELSRIAQSMIGQEGLSVQPPFITNARHRSHFRTAEQHLSAFLDLGPNDLVVAAEEVRYALQAIGRVTGHVDIEDVLDELFKGFCIGK